MQPLKGGPPIENGIFGLLERHIAQQNAQLMRVILKPQQHNGVAPVSLHNVNLIVLEPPDLMDAVNRKDDENRKNHAKPHPQAQGCGRNFCGRIGLGIYRIAQFQLKGMRGIFISVLLSALPAGTLLLYDPQCDLVLLTCHQANLVYLRNLVDIKHYRVLRVDISPYRVLFFFWNYPLSRTVTVRCAFPKGIGWRVFYFGGQS